MSAEQVALHVFYCDESVRDGRFTGSLRALEQGYHSVHVADGEWEGVRGCFPLPCHAHAWAHRRGITDYTVGYTASCSSWGVL